MSPKFASSGFIVNHNLDPPKSYGLPIFSKKGIGLATIPAWGYTIPWGVRLPLGITGYTTAMDTPYYVHPPSFGDTSLCDQHDWWPREVSHHPTIKQPACVFQLKLPFPVVQHCFAMLRTAWQNGNRRACACADFAGRGRWRTDRVHRVLPALPAELVYRRMVFI